MVNFMDFYYTGPGTLAGQYMRKFWHPVYRAEDLEARLGQADQNHGRTIHALSRR